MVDIGLCETFCVYKINPQKFGIHIFGYLVIWIINTSQYIRAITNIFRHINKTDKFPIKLTFLVTLKYFLYLSYMLSTQPQTMLADCTLYFRIANTVFYNHCYNHFIIIDVI